MSTGDGAHEASASTPPAIGGSLSTRRFWISLGVIAAAALALRVGYAQYLVHHGPHTLYDSFWYEVTAYEFRLGDFFRAPLATAPTAAHPPLTSFLLGVPLLVVGSHEVDGVLRMTMPVLGTGVVVLVGLLGRAVAGAWTGVVAAFAAAAAPNFWMPSGIAMSETPVMLCTALVLLAVVYVLRSPSLWSVTLLGVACGLEALARAEFILFVPTLLVPAVVAAHHLSGLRRFALVGVGVLATLVVVGPWVGRNLVTFHDATYISTGDGLALLGANCPQSYSGPYIGLWSLSCAAADPVRGDESVQSSHDVHVAIEYIRHHEGRLPVVVLARVGHVWDLYRPYQMAQVEAGEGRPIGASIAGLVVYYALLPWAVAGVVVLRRRRIRQWFLLVPFGVVTVIAALDSGITRFRAPAEVCLVVLAAPALVLAAGWIHRALGRSRPRPGNDPAGHGATADRAVDGRHPGDGARPVGPLSS
jgi:4-amino-4-deoxy-L-arabinose transferase-like glycosyltransferase